MFHRSYLSKSLIVGMFVLACIAQAGQAHAEPTIRVNFTEAMLYVEDDRGEIVFSTEVVLPSGDYYPVPTTGTLISAVMGPTWSPTTNMHRDFPGQYRAFYGPYETGNAMGYCKLSINFDQVSEAPILRTVRIHGNAQQADLGQRLSRSCVRIPDERCSELVSLVDGTAAQILFHR